MWIYKEDSEIVNTDFVKSIEKCIHNEDADYGPFYVIKFFYNKDYTVYKFESKEKCEEYYDALIKFINAQKVPLLKI